MTWKCDRNMIYNNTSISDSNVTSGIYIEEDLYIIRSRKRRNSNWKSPDETKYSGSWTDDTGLTTRWIFGEL